MGLQMVEQILAMLFEHCKDLLVALRLQFLQLFGLSCNPFIKFCNLLFVLRYRAPSSRPFFYPFLSLLVI